MLPPDPKQICVALYASTAELVISIQWIKIQMDFNVNNL